VTAAPQPPPSRLTFNRVMPLFTLTFVDVLGLTVILPLLHLYAVAFNASPVQIGFVAAAFPLAQLIGVPVMGALSDRYGRKPLLLISQVSTLIGFLLLASATSLEMIILSRLIDGLFGANLATAQAAITDLTDDHSRARGLGLTGAAFGLGFLLGPAIAFAALEFTDSLATPALIAAAYSLMSILITLFGFQETLLPSQRRSGPLLSRQIMTQLTHLLRRPQVPLLLGFMFAQQFIFYGFESLLGLFMLSRLGLLGQGSALMFIYVGLILVFVQLRLIGRLSQRYGERRVMTVALGLLAVGLLLAAFTPAQPQPFYIQRLVEREITALTPSGTEALIGELTVPLPDESARGLGGLLWFALALIPLAIGAGLIRPSVNALLTRRVGATAYGGVLGLSAAVVSLADATAPVVAGLVVQAGGIAAPFLYGGVVLILLLLLALRTVREPAAVERLV
jgi:MFS transporter, DHA1 family, tetracycline resistance protein